MKIINKILIDDYQQKHADSVKPLENWKELVKLDLILFWQILAFRPCR